VVGMMNLTFVLRSTKNTLYVNFTNVREKEGLEAKLKRDVFIKTSRHRQQHFTVDNTSGSQTSSVLSNPV